MSFAVDAHLSLPATDRGNPLCERAGPQNCYPRTPVAMAKSDALSAPPRRNAVAGSRIVALLREHGEAA